MGLGLFHKSNCKTYGLTYNDTKVVFAPAPNPNPLRWKLEKMWQFKNAHVMMIKYLDCTNYEGKKILVCEGQFDSGVSTRDPHFSEESSSPIARFKPDDRGWEMACELAESL